MKSAHLFVFLEKQQIKNVLLDISQMLQGGSEGSVDKISSVFLVVVAELAAVCASFILETQMHTRRTSITVLQKIKAIFSKISTNYRTFVIGKC